MSTEITVALISLCGILITGAVSIISSAVQAKRSHNDLVTKLEHHSELQDVRLEAKVEKYAAVTNERIDGLTREVRAHNNFAQRIPVLETEIKNIKAEVAHK